MSNYIQGKFKPKHPEKWVNSTNIIYRSSYELKYMMHIDNDPAVVKVKSEEQAISYRDPITGRLRRYFPDFIITKNIEGILQTFVVEIKPEDQTKPPKQTKGKKKKYLKEAITYAINLKKWEAATSWAKNRGMEFVLLTEKHLGIPSGK